MLRSLGLYQGVQTPAQIFGFFLLASAGASPPLISARSCVSSGDVLVQAVQTYLEKLASLAHAEGGWGYRPDQPPRLEPTCLALLALAQDPSRFKETVDKGWAFVHRAAVADGAYRLPGDREEAIWTTALVHFLQAAARGEGTGDVEQTAARLLAWKGRNPEQDQKNSGEIHDIDLRLIG